MTDIPPIVAISFIFLTVVNISKAVFQSAGYDTPILRLFSWVGWIIFLLCFAFFADKNNYDTEFDNCEEDRED